ncbi:hypothetical protein TSAR_005127, partial [Trichomalopsis sarcophagae]
TTKPEANLKKLQKRSMQKAGKNDNDPEDEEKYFLFMNHILVTEINSFINVVFILLASYLVFNRLWPPAVSCFLEFLQMRYMKFIDDKNRSKSKKNYRKDLFTKSSATLQDPVKLLSDMYLQLSTKYFVTEPIIENVVNVMYTAFQACSDQFKASLSNSNLSEDEKKKVLTISLKKLFSKVI